MGPVRLVRIFHQLVQVEYNRPIFNRRQAASLPYIIVTVAALEETPPAWITTCWLPDGAFGGMRTFNWYNPTKPGAKPEKLTSAPMLPTVTIGVLTIRESGSTLGAGCPLAGTGLTAPRPVA